MIKIHACQRNKQFIKDLEHNDFPVRIDLNLSSKELGKAIKINQKIARGFLHDFGIENYFKEREHLHVHYANVSVFLKFAKYRRY